MAVVVFDEESFDLALARSSPDVAFTVVVAEDGLDRVLARSSPDVPFAVAVVGEDSFDLALVLQGVAVSDDEASVTRAGRGETSVLAASDEASKVRAGETSEPAESNEASEVSKGRSKAMAPELVKSFVRDEE